MRFTPNLTILSVLALLVAGHSAGATVQAPPLGFHAPVKMPGSDNGTEPYIAIDKGGTRYATWQVPAMFAGSPDGVTFTQLTTPDANGSGDTSDAVDASGALYDAQICGNPPDTLHTCIYRSVDGGHTWPLQTQLADNHPGASDRPWIDVYPKSSNGPWDPDKTTVYLEYHTFSPEDLAYVTISHDGGHTFGPPILIEGDTNAIIGSGCNTIPSGVQVDQRDGTVYALWLSGNDVAHNLQTGCNYSQLGPFNKAWVSTSIDGGATWTANLAWTGQFDPVTDIGDNADKIFGALAIDGGGQVHVMLPARINDNPVQFVAPGGKETNQETDMLLVTSPDRGTHWTKPLDAPPEFRGSQFWPWMAAGAIGRIDAIYYQTTSLKPNGKHDVWFAVFDQITGAVAAIVNGKAKYVRTPAGTAVLLDPDPAHIGGICTFGIFCAVIGGNRNLADSISIALDPGGGANAIWTNDAGLAPSSEVDFACQNSGKSAFAGMPPFTGTCYGEP